MLHLSLCFSLLAALLPIRVAMMKIIMISDVMFCGSVQRLSQFKVQCVAINFRSSLQLVIFLPSLTHCLCPPEQ